VFHLQFEYNNMKRCSDLTFTWDPFTIVKTDKIVEHDLFKTKMTKSKEARQNYPNKETNTHTSRKQNQNFLSRPHILLTTWNQNCLQRVQHRCCTKLHGRLFFKSSWHYLTVQWRISSTNDSVFNIAWSFDDIIPKHQTTSDWCYLYEPCSLD